MKVLVIGGTRYPGRALVTRLATRKPYDFALSTLCL